MAACSTLPAFQRLPSCSPVHTWQPSENLSLPQPSVLGCDPSRPARASEESHHLVSLVESDYPIFVKMTHGH